jgi:hypothetical protein
MAMREGLALAHRLGCNNVIMESDSLETACNGDEAWWGESPAIFTDWVDLRAFIDNVSFEHCPREANESAHEIASFAFLLDLLGIGSMNPLAFSYRIL